MANTLSPLNRTTSPAPAPQTSQLGVGSRGEPVSELQRLLGGTGAHVSVDGVFGTKTAQALRSFQEAQGLPATGSADARTMDALWNHQPKAIPVEQPAPAPAPAPVSAKAQQGARQGHAQADVKGKQQVSGLLPHAATQVRTADVLAGAAVAKVGDSGPAVKDMQKALNKTELKPGLATTGTFSAQDHQALEQYQKSRGLPVTGNLDAQSANALQNKRRPAGEAPPEKHGWSLFGSHQADKASGVTASHGSEARKYDEYRAVIEQHGGKFKDGPEQRNILAMRTPTNVNANNAHGAYDDKTVMLWQDAKGNKHVREYQSNTDPTSQYAGKNGFASNPGRLQEGYHEYRSRLFNPDASDSIKQALEPIRAVKYQRISAEDGKSVVGSGANTSFLFHGGASDNTLSAGCQTMPPQDWSRFWNDVHAAGDPGVIGYTVIRR